MRAFGRPAPSKHLPMPRPSVLTKTTVVSHANGTLTLRPGTSASPAVSPRAVWATLGPQSAAGTRQLFLATFSASTPAKLQANGSLMPTYQHVLAWVEYGKKLPFDTATASRLQSPDATSSTPSCTFVGQEIDGMGCHDWRAEFSVLALLPERRSISR